MSTNNRNKVTDTNISITVFPSEAAQSKGYKAATLDELRTGILQTSKPRKADLPWLKPAVFGELRSPRNSLRHDHNVKAISGIAVDYDQQKMPFDELLAILRKANLRALAYTSPSHKADAPKWRVILPTSHNIALPTAELKAQHAALAARINGVLGGVLDPASFKLSQSYYYGCVNNNPDHRAEITEGDCIDLRDDLDASAIGPSKADVAADNYWSEYGAKHIDVELELSGVRPGNVHDPIIHATSSLISSGYEPEEALDLIIEGLRDNPHCADWDFDDPAKREEILKDARQWQEKIAKKDAEAEAEKLPVILIMRPYDYPPEDTQPHRDYLYGYHLIRGEVGGSAAPGGLGKSTMSITETTAMCSGRALLGLEVKKPLRVLHVNLEDPRHEINRRIMAAMRHHEVKRDEMSDRLFVWAKGDVKFKIATIKRGVVIPEQRFIEALGECITKNGIDVVSLDPFIRTHKVPENLNVEIAEVVTFYEELAQQCKCAFSIWHHNRKSKGEGVSVDDARGASSFVDACRSVRMLELITKDEAKKYGIEDHRRSYFKSFSGKLNFSPPVEKAETYRIVNVEMLNYTTNSVDAAGSRGGDRVGVVEHWTPQTITTDLNEEQIAKVKEALREPIWREDVRAGEWAGKVVGGILGLDVTIDQKTIKAQLDDLQRKGILRAVQHKDKSSKRKLYLVSEDPEKVVIRQSEEATGGSDTGEGV